MGTLAAATAAVLLSACSGQQQDDPANPPQLGDWKISRLAKNLSTNGRTVSEEEHTRAYLASGASPANSRTECTEPKLADQSWLAGYIGAQLDRKCSITEATQSGSSVQGKGVCGEAERGDGRPNETSFHYYGEASADSFDATAQVRIASELESGETDSTSMTVKIEGKRSGECGSDLPAGTFRG